MQIKYYETAWRDISNSPNWFGKLCLLALVNFVPVFGQIVTFGYLYGWAREIAWGVHAPMPAKIFNNDDGKFWWRGWFVLVVTVVFAIIPSIITGVGQALQGAGFWAGDATGVYGAGNAALATAGSIVYFVGLIAQVLVGILVWVSAMRISIYDKLSAGFQLGKVWKMFRHDTGGIMRIFGMELLVGLIISVVLSIVITMLMMVIMFAGVAGLAAAGYSASSLQHMTDAQAIQLAMTFFSSAGVIGILSFFAMVYATLLATMFLDALIIRAIGYWTRQFDVPRWRGQDDPMPFEVASFGMPQATQPSAYASPAPQAGQSYGAAPGPSAGFGTVADAEGGSPQAVQPPAYGSPVPGTGHDATPDLSVANVAGSGIVSVPVGADAEPANNEAAASGAATAPDASDPNDAAR